jgi:predicted dehydrogenase
MIGAGGIALTHASCLREIDGARIAGVVDPARDPAEALAAECGAVVFDDLASLLDETDAVYVCDLERAPRTRRLRRHARGRPAGG